MPSRQPSMANRRIGTSARTSHRYRRGDRRNSTEQSDAAGGDGADALAANFSASGI
jgi:hypothetical protein